MQAAKPTEFDIGIASDLHRWRAFVAIAELGSITRAALFLDSNQSLLSRQLNALERDCGARLFTRTGRGVQLSELGAHVFPRVKTLLADAALLDADIRGEALAPTGRVTLGLLPSISQTITAPLFAALRERFASVSLKILEGSGGQVEEWLADARIDIAILYRYGMSAHEMEQPLAVVDSYLIGPRRDALTRNKTVAFDRLDGLPLVLPSAPNGLRRALDSIARQRDIALSPAIEADSLPLQKSLTARDGLYTVLPIHAVWHELEDGSLQASQITDPPVQRTISMAMARSKNPSRAVAAVASQIEAIVREMAETGIWHRDRPQAPADA